VSPRSNRFNLLVCPLAPNPGPENLRSLRVALFEEAQQKRDDRHVLCTNVARWAVANDISVCRVVENRIGATVDLIRTVTAPWKRLHAGVRDDRAEEPSAKQLLITLPVEVTEAKAAIPHLRQHAGLIRGIDIGVVVVDGDANPSPRRGLQINVSG